MCCPEWEWSAVNKRESDVSKLNKREPEMKVGELTISGWVRKDKSDSGRYLTRSVYILSDLEGNKHSVKNK